jgi:hypothetical protein
MGPLVVSMPQAVLGPASRATRAPLDQLRRQSLGVPLVPSVSQERASVATVPRALGVEILPAPRLASFPALLAPSARHGLPPQRHVGDSVLFMGGSGLPCAAVCFSALPLLSPIPHAGPPGVFGNSTSLANASCTAPCPIGAYCTSASVVPVLCPPGCGPASSQSSCGCRWVCTQCNACGSLRKPLSLPLSLFPCVTTPVPRITGELHCCPRGN